ncbi:lycopene cyclase family protein [Maribacter litopenaei]|uniref:Lycopene cyclase family protein n=1 Tax=Maribacter litopenaei TaxID=2976127 RepID=A0ABY5Y834_9FLAO|nr:lycopene cyclase family protein [Maribacter litopenaei]UWX55182.1 lycopene cyclase family protein [Maribacter litopenaei]
MSFLFKKIQPWWNTLFFQRTLLSKTEYEEAIKDYIHNRLHCETYEILDREQGSIPMTSFDFTKNNTELITHIGTAGGWAKPSTGYTFLSTSKKIPLLISNLKAKGKKQNLKQEKRFWFYDLLFLDVLYRTNQKGHAIFTNLFRNRKPQLIFKFLDEETNLWEDIYYILGCPKWPFIKAFFRRLF